MPPGKYGMTEFWQGKKVLVTGHSGFKGGWLSLWLAKLGAQVSGLSLFPPSYPNLYTRVNLSKYLFSDKRGDIRDLKDVKYVIGLADPEIIFHLAAQPLVREGYREPAYTFETNVIGTVNVLEAVRELKNIKSVVIITTDKVYDDSPKPGGYTEDCRLGGYDPYATSKVCAEHVVRTYSNCYLNEISVSTARAGNVVGGGDWGQERLVPDCIKSIQKGEDIHLRNPMHTRPWQFVLEPLYGYMLAAELGYWQLVHEAWNFGPKLSDCMTVANVAATLSKIWNERTGKVVVPAAVATDTAFHETENLELNSDKAFKGLGWKSIWDIEKTLQSVMDWYTIYPNAYEACMSQIEEYENDRKKLAERDLRQNKGIL